MISGASIPELAEVQAHVLHFSVSTVLDEAPLCRVELEQNYPVHEPYFFLPNQFWQHKNHAVVVEALRRSPRAHSRNLHRADGGLPRFRLCACLNG